MMKKIFCFIFLLMVSNAYAEFWGGLEGNVAYLKTQDKADVNSAHEGFGVNTGYRFNQYFGAEAFYKRFTVQSPEYNIQNDSTRFGFVNYTDHVIGLGGRFMWKWLGVTAGLASHSVTEKRTIRANSGISDPASKTKTIQPYAGLGFIIPHYEKVQPYGEVIFYQGTVLKIGEFSLGARYFF